MADDTTSTTEDQSTGLLGKIEALLNRGPTTTAAADDDDSRSVPYARFRQVNERMQAAETGLREVLGEVQKLRNDFVPKADVATQVAALGMQHHEDMQLRDAGLDADGRDALRTTWARQPEADRGDSASAWWAKQLEGVKAYRADPENGTMPELPRTLVPYLPAEATNREEPAARSRPGIRGVQVGRQRSVDRGVVNGRNTQSQADRITAAVAAGDTAAYWAALNSGG
jgi:hypothetical protein